MRRFRLQKAGSEPFVEFCKKVDVDDKHDTIADVGAWADEQASDA